MRRIKQIEKIVSPKTTGVFTPLNLKVIAAKKRVRKQRSIIDEAVGRTIDADADANADVDMAEIAGVTPLGIKAMILVAVDVKYNDGFTPHNLKMVIETGMSVKLLITAFNRVALGRRSEYNVVDIRELE